MTVCSPFIRSFICATHSECAPWSWFASVAGSQGEHTTLLSTFRSSFRSAQEAFIVSPGDTEILFRLQERQWLSSRGHGGGETLVYSRLEWCPSRGYGLVECPAPCFPWKTMLDGLRRKGDIARLRDSFVNTGISFIFAEDDIENLKERRVRIKREMRPWSMGSYYTVQPP